MRVQVQRRQYRGALSTHRVLAAVHGGLRVHKWVPALGLMLRVECLFVGEGGRGRPEMSRFLLPQFIQLPGRRKESKEKGYKEDTHTM